jgi:large subunit ribosomal protein L10
MPTEKKVKVVDSLQETFKKSQVGILADYRGMLTSDVTVLRRRLQANNSELKVVKNTLAKLAAEKAGKKKIGPYLTGPVAIAFGYGDVTAPSRVITTYIAETKSTMKIKGGFLGDTMITSEQVTTLGRLPSKEVLLARVFGQMKAPMSLLVGTLSAPMSGFVGVLQARIKQLEGEKSA